MFNGKKQMCEINKHVPFRETLEQTDNKDCRVSAENHEPAEVPSAGD